MKGFQISIRDEDDQVVLDVGKINFSGNIIPHTWYQSIMRKNGKPNLVAITILSDIVYWYRPIEIRDERTGQFLGWRKKFKADKLQRGYADFAKMYGVSKGQVKAAMDELEEQGIINREFRTIVMKNGRAANNVLYIGLNSDTLLDITYPPSIDRGRLPRSNNRVPLDSSGESPPMNRGTNTETTTETTTENYPTAQAADSFFENNGNQQKNDSLLEAIKEVFGTAPGQTRVIYRQMMGQTSKKNRNYTSDFSPPATMTEVIRFAAWWRSTYPTLNLPTSPTKLQNHFYAFREEGAKKRKRRIEWDTETIGRWLEFNESSQRWMDKGAAKREGNSVLVLVSGEWKEVKRG